MRFKRSGVAAAATILLLALTGAPAYAAPAAKAATSSSVRITLASSSKPVAADWIKITGTTSKSLSGRTLTVERRKGSGKWAAVGTTHAGKKRALSVRTRATGTGAYSYRVSAAKSKTVAAAHSNSVRVTVFRWYYLSDLNDAGRNYYNGFSPAVGAATMAGRAYYNSIRFSGYKNSRYEDFNTSYKCSTFDATAGIVDTSTGTPAASFALLADGTQVAQSNVSLGKTAGIRADVTGIFRIRLQVGFTFTAPGSAAWGDPRVLCSGQPADNR